jgi:hypothetical protein
VRTEIRPHVGTVDPEIVGAVLVRAVLRLVQKAADSDKDRGDTDPETQYRMNTGGNPPGASDDYAERNDIGEERVDRLQHELVGLSSLYRGLFTRARRCFSIKCAARVRPRNGQHSFPFVQCKGIQK